ncbi:hypothetical protein GCM10009534_18170 [Kribbella sandramycini]
MAATLPPDPLVDHLGQILTRRRLPRGTRRLHTLTRVAKLVVRLRHPTIVPQTVTAQHPDVRILPNSSRSPPRKHPFSVPRPTGIVFAMTASTWLLTLLAGALWIGMLCDIDREVRDL